MKQPPPSIPKPQSRTRDAEDLDELEIPPAEILGEAPEQDGSSNVGELARFERVSPRGLLPKKRPAEQTNPSDAIAEALGDNRLFDDPEVAEMFGEYIDYRVPSAPCKEAGGLGPPPLPVLLIPLLLFALAL